MNGRPDTTPWWILIPLCIALPAVFIAGQSPGALGAVIAVLSGIFTVSLLVAQYLSDKRWRETRKPPNRPR